MTDDFVEECWFIYGLRMGNIYLGFLKYSSKGTAASVDFDWRKAMAPLFIGWYHSHPGVKFLTPSERDNRTMRSWIKGLAKPMLCGIFCQDEQQCYCYFKSPWSTRRETVICRDIVKSRIHGPLFFGVRQIGGYEDVV